MANSSSSSTRLLAVGVLVLLVGVVLVLLILRDDGTPATEGSGVAQPADDPTDQQTTGAVTPEQQAEDLGAAAPSAIRIDSYDPLDVREGFEAVAVKVRYERAVASLPYPGDLVRVYRLPTSEDMDAANPPDPTAVPAPGALPTIPPGNPPAELVLQSVDVLGVIGPAPASNSDSELTLVLEVPTNDVPRVMQLANDDEIYVSLLPRPEAEPTESESASESASEASS